MLSFSTCWNNARHIDGEDVIDEILELGFKNIEISHGTTISRLPGIQRAFDAGKFTCSGVHNYFPAPLEVLIDAPDAYQFTDKDPYKRKRAMDLTLKTLEVAASFNAKYVVLHMGSVPMRHHKWSQKLTEWAKDDLQDDAKFQKFKAKLIKKRAKIGPQHYQLAIQALETIAEKAKEYGVPVGIESRSRYEDVPSEPEMLALQEHFKDNPWVGYWHDFGHVQLKHNIDLLDHSEWLSSMKPYLLGCHVHDVEYPARDHRVPFGAQDQRGIDYPPLFDLIDKQKPMVWELSPSQKTEAILAAKKVWDKKNL